MSEIGSRYWRMLVGSDGVFRACSEPASSTLVSVGTRPGRRSPGLRGDTQITHQAGCVWEGPCYLPPTQCGISLELTT